MREARIAEIRGRHTSMQARVLDEEMNRMASAMGY